jgi:hypothetical protein
VSNGGALSQASTPTPILPSQLGQQVNQISLIKQPPPCTVYQRILKPYPVISLDAKPGPNDSFFVETTLVRADSEVEIPSSLDGIRTVPVKLGFATFKKLKILTTSLQQGTNFCLKFVLKRHIGNTFEQVGNSVKSEVIEVVSHSQYIKEKLGMYLLVLSCIYLVHLPPCTVTAPLSVVHEVLPSNNNNNNNNAVNTSLAIPSLPSQKSTPRVTEVVLQRNNNNNNNNTEDKPSVATQSSMKSTPRVTEVIAAAVMHKVLACFIAFVVNYCIMQATVRILIVAPSVQDLQQEILQSGKVRHCFCLEGTLFRPHLFYFFKQIVFF